VAIRASRGLRIGVVRVSPRIVYTKIGRVDMALWLLLSKGHHDVDEKADALPPTRIDKAG
jgi:hypothetical protein